MSLAVEYENAWLEYPLGTPRPPKLAHIMNAVVLHTGVSAFEIKSQRRTKNVLRARHIFCYVARHTTLVSYPIIGRHLDRDHTTIISAVARVERLLNAGDEKLRADIDAITVLTERIASQNQGRTP